MQFIQIVEISLYEILIYTSILINYSESKMKEVMQLLFKNFEPIMKWVKLWVKLRIACVIAFNRMTIGTDNHRPESIPSARQGCTNLPLFAKGNRMQGYN